MRARMLEHEPLPGMAVCATTGLDDDTHQGHRRHVSVQQGNCRPTHVLKVSISISGPRFRSRVGALHCDCETWRA